jgi:hypothetical protein
MIEQAKVPILKETGVTLPFVSASNYRGWILCDRSLSEEAPLLCVVSQEDLDLRAGIREGDHLIIAVGLDPEIGEYAVTLFGGRPTVGAIIEVDGSFALDVGISEPILIDNQCTYAGCVVALIRKF